MSPNSRGRPPGRGRVRVKEYMCERGTTTGEGLDQARMEGGDFSAIATPLGDIPGGSEGSKL